MQLWERIRERLFPISLMPDLLKAIADVNPLTYVDALRG